MVRLHFVMRWSVMSLGTVAALCLNLCFEQSAFAQNADQAAADAAEPKYELRIYNLSGLVDVRQDFPYTGDLPGASGAPGFMTSGGLGMSGGLGGGMGGLRRTRGGGFFSMPAAPQFGGGGGDGGGAGGMMGGGGGGLGGGGLGGGGLASGMGGPGMGMGLGSGAKDVATSLEENGEEITTLIETYVEPDSWEASAGTGSLRQVGSLLLVRQTERVHQQVAAFLKTLTDENPGHQQYQLEVWWLPLNAKERDEFLQSEVKLTDNAQRLNYIRTIAENSRGFHGSVKCLDRTITHFSSGVRKPVIVGVVPVVGGGNATGEQPIVRHLHVGVLLEAYVTPLADHLINPDQPGEFSEIRYRAIVTRDDPSAEQMPAAKIDRFRLGAHVSEGAGVVQLGRPTIMSSLTSVAIPPVEGNDQNEIYLVMLLTKVGAE